MTKTKDYIQFWIDNWYDLDMSDIMLDDWWFNTSIVELIMEKEFIESIARGVEKMDYVEIWNFNYHPHILSYKWYYIGTITSGQAMAIREKTLDKYITKLLWQKQ